MSELGPIGVSDGPSPVADPDRGLVDRIVAGDLDALDGLYERYGTMAYSIALRITGEPAAAEDVVQEAFLGAWRNAARYVGGRGSVKTWLLAIVHHRAIDAIRRRRTTSELPEADAPMPEAFTVPDVWGDVSEGLDREALQFALTTISAVQREAIELAYFGGLTQVEIATRLRLPLGTVKSRMRLGLLGLRRALSTDVTPSPFPGRDSPRSVDDG
jgi:RNA polymerase sigma-70 factor (ECF subfamily)